MTHVHSLVRTSTQMESYTHMHPWQKYQQRLSFRASLIVVILKLVSIVKSYVSLSRSSIILSCSYLINVANTAMMTQLGRMSYGFPLVTLYSTLFVLLHHSFCITNNNREVASILQNMQNMYEQTRDNKYYFPWLPSPGLEIKYKYEKFGSYANIME